LLLAIGLNAQNQYFSAYNQGDLSYCIEQAEERMQLDSATAIDYFYHAAALMRKGDLKTAEQSFKKANELKFQGRSFYFYHMAMLSTSQKNYERSIAYLDSVLSLSTFSYFPIEDSLFMPIKDQAEFKSRKAQIRAKVFPCDEDPKHTKLDFWIGNWDVFVNGSKRADSKISRPEGNCMLYEYYTTLGDFSGQSFNFFDQQRNAYHQIWINFKAGKTEYYEVEAKDGYLMMETDSTSNPRLRMSYTLLEDGNVRQLMHQYDSSKATWNQVFDGLYIKK